MFNFYSRYPNHLRKKYQNYSSKMNYNTCASDITDKSQFNWLIRVYSDAIMHCYLWDWFALSPFICFFPQFIEAFSKNINTIKLLKYKIYQKARMNRPKKLFYSSM